MTQIIGKLVKKERPPTPVFLGFPSGSVGEESACNAGDRGLIPGLGRSPGEGNSYPLQYSKIMASGPITSWQMDGETMETVTDFILGGSKITADGDCNHEIKRHLPLGRKFMTNLDSIFKSRDITSSSHVWM